MSIVEENMQKRIAILFIAALVLISCASPAPEPTVTTAPSATHTAAPTVTISPPSTETLTPTATTLPDYDKIDPNIGEKLKASGIVIPPELQLDANGENALGINLDTDNITTYWVKAYDELPEIPITIIPEVGISQGTYHIKGIKLIPEAQGAVARQYIVSAWIAYREYGDPADKDITLESYISDRLAKGLGGVGIPQYDPVTKKFMKEEKIFNPLAGIVMGISDNDKGDLPVKYGSSYSGLFVIGADGELFVFGNDLEADIEDNFIGADKEFFDKNRFMREPGTALGLLDKVAKIALFGPTCMRTGHPTSQCIGDSSDIEAKYRQVLNSEIAKLYTDWVNGYRDGKTNVPPPFDLVR